MVAVNKLMRYNVMKPNRQVNWQYINYIKCFFIKNSTKWHENESSHIIYQWFALKTVHDFAYFSPESDDNLFAEESNIEEWREDLYFTQKQQFEENLIKICFFTVH